MATHTEAIHRLLPANCLTVFDHFAGLALKGLTHFIQSESLYNQNTPKKVFSEQRTILSRRKP